MDVEQLKTVNTFSGWLNIYRNYAHPGTDLEKIALDKMMKLADNFEHLHAFYRFTIRDPRATEHRNTLIKMTEMASSFSNWANIHIYDSSKEGELRKTAISKMSELATRFEQWYIIYLFSQPETHFRKQAYAKMLELGTFNDWHSVYMTSVRFPSNQCEEILEAMKKIVKTDDELAMLKRIFDKLEIDR